MVLTGAMRPEKFRETDADIHIGLAIGAVQLKKEFTEVELAKQTKAAKSCPAHAIEIYDDAGKKIV